MILPPKEMKLAEELQLRLDAGKTSDEAILVTLMGLASKEHLDPSLIAPVLKYVFRGDLLRILATLQKAEPYLDKHFVQFVEKSIPSR